MVLSLSESNAISDVNSVTSVIQDVFAFFEDGMTVLIGAAVGAGDPAAAGTLTLLGYLGGVGFGVVGSGFGTAAGLWPWLMDLVIPTPKHHCATAAAAAGVLASEAQLKAIALPYWLISVWTWSFAFCNKVGTGVVLGTNSLFDWALATVVGQAVAIGSFLVFVAADGVPNAAAVGKLPRHLGCILPRVPAISSADRAEQPRQQRCVLPRHRARGVQGADRTAGAAALARGPALRRDDAAGVGRGEERRGDDVEERVLVKPVL